MRNCEDQASQRASAPGSESRGTRPGLILQTLWEARFLRPRGLQHPEQRLELLAAVGAALQMGPDQRHPGCAVFATLHRLSELIQQLMDLVAVEFDLLGGVELSQEHRARPRRQAGARAGGAGEP